MKRKEIDLMAMSEKELRELFNRVDLGDLMPTIEEIEDELERNYDRYMSSTPRQYRREVGVK